MKKVTFLTAIALTSLSAFACTVTVGEEFEDDSDFVDDADDDFVDDADDSDFVNDSDEDASDVDTDTDESNEASSDDETTNSATSTASTADAGESTGATTNDNETTTAQDESSTSNDSSSSEPVSPVEPDQCADLGEAYSCTECMNFYCSAEWYACCGEPGCVETWNQITTCVVNTAMSPDDPIQDVDRCADMFAPEGMQFNYPEGVTNLISCVGFNYEFPEGEDDPHGHQPGDGTCTLACYNVPTLFPADEE